MISPAGMTFQIKWQEISFPSDQLTIGQIRRAHQENIDGSPNGSMIEFFDRPLLPGNAKDILGRLLGAERVLLENAAGVVPCDAKRIGEYLAREYVRLGLASGDHQAKELIKGIERQGRAFLTER